MRRYRTLALGAATLALVMSACSSGEGSSSTAASQSQAASESMMAHPSISVGSAGFYEAAVVGEIYAQALENAGYEVDRHLEIGERPAVQAALSSGDVNLVPEYLGGLASYLEADVSSDAQETWDNLQTALEGEGLVAYQFSPGTDADGWVVRQETADDLGLATMSDVAAVADQLVWGLAPACSENPVCGPGLKDTYGIDISKLDVESLSPCSTEMAQALNNSAIDVAQVCTTQPEVSAFNFVLLDDDKHLQPAQNMVPVLTQDLANAGGDDLETLLNSISEKLTTEALTDLGVAIQINQEDMADVARQFLEDNGLA